MEQKFISVCSGVEAASEAWLPLGWKPQFYSEIEKFPASVLEYRHPGVPNLGDMTKFKEWSDYDADVLVGGTPCQSYSIAGLRKGLDDPRGNLMLTYLAIAGRYRPRWVVWENVPGVLSSNKGRDFGTFLGALGQLGYGFAFRVLNAQYFGVAQRRYRVFVVGCLGGWQCAGAVLFEQDSMCGNPSPSENSRKEASTQVGGSPSHWGGQDMSADGFLQVVHGTQDPCVSDKAFTVGRNNGGENVVCFAQNTRNEVREMKVSGALAAQPGSKQQSFLREGLKVRRLTPVECERLQGFPDDYTRIPWRNKPADSCPDGQRYKALGNSMAVPVMKWIGQRVEEVENVVRHKAR